jgi:hypothetical protein
VPGEFEEKALKDSDKYEARFRQSEMCRSIGSFHDH